MDLRKPTVDEVIDKAIEVVGSRTSLAARFGISEFAVIRWGYRQAIPPQHVCPLAHLTDFLPWEIDPVIFDQHYAVTARELRLIRGIRDKEMMEEIEAVLEVK